MTFVDWGTTGGTGTGFQLFTQSNNVAGIYADAAARDVYFGANPADLARLDADEFLIIKLLDNGSGDVAYQQRDSGTFLDVTSLVTGPDGSAANFANVSEGAIPSLSSDLVNFEDSGATRQSNGAIVFGDSAATLGNPTSDLIIASLEPRFDIVDTTGGGTRYPAIEICGLDVDDCQVFFSGFFDGTDIRASDPDVYSLTKTLGNLRFEAATGATIGAVVPMTVRATLVGDGRWAFGTANPTFGTSFDVQFLAGNLARPWGTATTAVIDALTGVEGAGLWNSDANRLRIYDGTAYQNVAWVSDVSGNVTTSDTLTDNFLVRGNGGVDIDICTSDDTAGIFADAASAQLSIRAVTNATVGFGLQDDTGTTILNIGYDDQLNTSTLDSAADFTFDVSAGALNFSVSGADEDVNIDSVSGRVVITTPGGTAGDNILLNDLVTVDTTGQFVDIALDSATGVAQYTLSDFGGTEVVGLRYAGTSGAATLGVTGTLAVQSTGNLTVDSTAGALSLVGSTAVDITASTTSVDIFSTTLITLNSGTQTIVLDDSTVGGQNAGLTIEQVGTGDAVLHFDLTAQQDWTLGVINNLADLFAIGPATSLDATAPLQILTSGEVGINKTPRANHCLDIDTSTNTVVALYDQKDVTLEQGNFTSNSTDFFFNRADAGFNQSEFYQYNNNNNSGSLRFFKLNYTFAGTTGGLSVRRSGFVGVGVDLPDTIQHVLSDAADTTAVLTTETTGTNGASVATFVGDRDPNGVVTGAGGDQYRRANGVTSASYESVEATTGTAWFRRSLLPSTVIEINTSAQFEDLATAGTITITSDTTLIFNTLVTTSTVFDVSASANLSLREGAVNSGIVFSGVDTLFTGANAHLSVVGLQLTASAGGILLDWEHALFQRVRFSDNAVLVGWNMGEVRRLSTAETGGAFQMQNVVIVNWLSGLSLVSVILSANSTVIDQSAGGDAGEAFFQITNNAAAAPPVISITHPQGVLEPGETYVRFGPGIPNTSNLLVSSSSTIINGSSFFDISGTAPTAFTSVNPSNIGPFAVTSVTDNGGVAVFNHANTTPFLGSTVTLSGFVTNTAYNVTGVVTASTATTFEIDFVAFGSDETGTYSAIGITINSASHGLANGTGVTLDTDDATEYDGGFVIYNITGNAFSVAATFGATQSGTWSTEGLDQRNPNVLAVNNTDVLDSKYIASGFVNANATVTGTIVNNTFTDMVFGTAGTALVQASNTERWKLVDELNGTYEYTGNEPFDGQAQFAVTSVSSGGAVEFRFKMVHDVGAGFVDLPDDVQALKEVGSTADSTNYLAPLVAAKGDQIKPQITRNTGTSGITTSYFSFIAAG